MIDALTRRDASVGSPIGFGPALKPERGISLEDAERSANEGTDILSRFHHLKELWRIKQRVAAEASRVRDGLVERYGEITKDWSCQAAWEADADRERLSALNDASDDLCNKFWELADELFEIPARTVEEFFIKIRLVALDQPQLSDKMLSGEYRTVSVLREFNTFMGKRP